MFVRWIERVVLGKTTDVVGGWSAGERYGGVVEWVVSWRVRSVLRN